MKVTLNQKEKRNFTFIFLHFSANGRIFKNSIVLEITMHTEASLLEGEGIFEGTSKSS